MIIKKTKKEIEAMREGGKILSGIVGKLEKEIIPGKKTLELDSLANRLVFDSRGEPAFLGYGKETDNPFPATICASLNDEVVHGIPEKGKILKEGDLLKIDIGMRYKGMVTDMARTFVVGEGSKEVKKIKNVVSEALHVGIAGLRPGIRLSHYGRSVQKFVEEKGFSVVRELVGHGVGKEVHEDPYIFNFWSENENNDNIILEEGMTFAFEPMINAGEAGIKLAEDGWAYKTRDGSLSAHWEDTIVVTEDGVESVTNN